jgi:hypothetical protein
MQKFLLGLKRIAISFTSNFGLIWLFIQPAELFWPDKLNHGWVGYGGLVIFSLVIAIVRNFPRRIISYTLSAPNSTIEIKIGDLFKEQTHLVIGTNDVFDTQLGQIIKPSAVQGQFLRYKYNNDIARLDADIQAALQEKGVKGKKDNSKNQGKSWRYPIGTTITLGSPENCYFWTAYGHMSNDIKVQSNVDYIWNSLSNLWKEVRRKGNGMDVAIPIIGSDLARTNLPRMTLVQLIIISFVAASKKEFIGKKLTVIVYPQDLDTINFFELENFLASVCF